MILNKYVYLCRVITNTYKIMKATFNISKILTICGENFVQSFKMSEFETEAVKYSEVIIKSWCSMAKYLKYADILTKNGFSLKDKINFEVSENGKDVNFYVVFSK